MPAPSIPAASCSWSTCPAGSSTATARRLPARAGHPRGLPVPQEPGQRGRGAPRSPRSCARCSGPRPDRLDQEGGSVVRATTLPQAPRPWRWARGRRRAARAVGAAVARGLRRLGVNWNFAPVLDVNNNPANPVIAERSFSAEPDRVTRLAGPGCRVRWPRAWPAASSISRPWRHARQDSHHALPGGRQVAGRAGALELRPFARCRHTRRR
jgi:hypothetical protein